MPQSPVGDPLSASPELLTPPPLGSTVNVGQAGVSAVSAGHYGGGTVSSTASLITVIAAWAFALIVIAVAVRVGPEQFNKIDF